jgi:hypothetical protein
MNPYTTSIETWIDLDEVISISQIYSVPVQKHNSGHNLSLFYTKILFRNGERMDYPILNTYHRIPAEYNLSQVYESEKSLLEEARNIQRDMVRVWRKLPQSGSPQEEKRLIEL